MTSLSSKRSLRVTAAAILAAVFASTHGPAAMADMPDEPIEIGTKPQLFVDDYLVDNRFAVKGSAKQMVLRKFHAPVKHGDRAVLIDPDTVPSQHAFRFDPEAKLFSDLVSGAVCHRRPRGSEAGRVAGVSAHPLCGVEGRHPLVAARARPRRVSRQRAQ